MKRFIICTMSILTYFLVYAQQVQYQECTGCHDVPHKDGTPAVPRQNFPYGANTPYRSQRYIF